MMRFLAKTEPQPLASSFIAPYLTFPIPTSAKYSQNNNSIHNFSHKNR